MTFRTLHDRVPTKRLDAVRTGDQVLSGKCSGTGSRSMAPTSSL